MERTSEEKLNSLSDHRLAEVVRDWEVHGYAEETRQLAISILNNRGITEEQLKINGYWTNHDHNVWKQRAKSGGRIAMVILILYIFLKFVLPPLLRFFPESYSVEITIAIWILAVGFFTLQIYWQILKK